MWNSQCWKFHKQHLWDEFLSSRVKRRINYVPWYSNFFKRNKKKNEANNFVKNQLDKEKFLPGSGRKMIWQSSISTKSESVSGRKPWDQIRDPQNGRRIFQTGNSWLFVGPLEGPRTGYFSKLPKQSCQNVDPLSLDSEDIDVSVLYFWVLHDFTDFNHNSSVNVILFRLYALIYICDN